MWLFTHIAFISKCPQLFLGFQSCTELLVFCVLPEVKQCFLHEFMCKGFCLTQVNSYFTCSFSFLPSYIFSPFFLRISSISFPCSFCVFPLHYTVLFSSFLSSPSSLLTITYSVIFLPYGLSFTHFLSFLNRSSSYQWFPEVTFLYSPFLFQVCLNFLWAPCFFGFHDPTPTCVLVEWAWGRCFLHNTKQVSWHQRGVWEFNSILVLFTQR